MDNKIATKGSAAFMLKQSAILKKKRQKSKVYQADDAIFKKSVKESPGRVLVASRTPIGYRSN